MMIDTNIIESLLSMLLLFSHSRVRELFVWLEMVPSSDTEFKKVDAGAARYRYDTK